MSIIIDNKDNHVHVNTISLKGQCHEKKRLYDFNFSQRLFENRR